MDSFENFEKNNRAFGSYYIPSCHEKEMRDCYEIAKKVEETYQQTYGHIDGPRIGDIVEFADEFKVHNHAKIVENLYGDSKYGMLCVCKSGTSHTNGKGFSTSGGPFVSIHKSKLQLVGDAENLVWTWGCYGSGANQGIYFHLKVRKWIVPYEKPQCLSKVTIHGRGKKRNDGREFDAVSISNFSEFYNAQSFCSIKAFLAWAEYVGYTYKSWGCGAFQKVSPQRIEDKCFTEKTWQPPKGAKPIKVIRNGRLKDAWVVTTDDAITYYWPNIYDPSNPEPSYGSPEYEQERLERMKYYGNPMGIEL